jgi:phenylacetic acid degradation protein paaN
MNSLFDKHAALLDGARRAIRARTYWSAYPESPSSKVYGDAAATRAQDELAALTQRRFSIDGHPVCDWRGAEGSPYGESLSATYPACDVNTLVETSVAGSVSWAAASIKDRVGVCMEMLERLNRQSHLIAYACRLTTGQPFLMAFQSGGPHAQERGLEAVAYAFEEMSRVPRSARWDKPMGKAGTVRLDKSFSIVPRGVAVVIGCGTFPTWNSYGALFASLCTGNSVIVKPHPSSILPLALTVRTLREVLKEQSFDPNLVLLAPDTHDAPIARTLVMHPAVRSVDFTGGPAFGSWLRENACHARVYTEEAGVNSIIVDGTQDYRGMCQNVALSLCLFSGQMCTSPQNILIRRDGIDTNEGTRTFEEVAHSIRDAVQSLLSDPARAESILGAIQSEQTLQRIIAAADEGPVLLRSTAIRFPGAPSARTATPLIRRADASDSRFFLQERFGPISYFIATASTEQSIALAEEAALKRGAITMGVYSRDPTVLQAAERAARCGGVSLSCNLTGNFVINQNAAFSDYHVSGANPAGTACLTDAAFVADRFRVVCTRSYTE